jgi:vacuolar protein sorting-associated protein VTA1
VRFYIIQKIIGAGLHTADAECTTYTANLMDRLEQTKAAHPDEDALHDETAAQAYCEQFAFTTFAKGEKDMAANAVTKSTADTLLAAATFFEMITLWKKDPEPEVKSKQKFAKYHAARILKALRSGEDPNRTNPVHEPPAVASPSLLDPNDPEVQNLAPNTPNPSARNPYQPYVESAPDTTAQPSPTISGPKVSPPILPSAPTDYSAHRDVSPISQPGNASRQGSVVSEGGGYFPRVNVPTFTADTAAPNLPTAPSLEDEPMGDNPFDPPSLASSLPAALKGPQAPQAPSPQDFYNNAASPAPIGQSPHQAPPPQASYQPSPNPYATPPPQPQPPAFQQPQQPQFNNAFAPHQPQHAPLQQPHTQPSQAAVHQGPFKTDEEAQMAAAKHAKWAISALNFEDVHTAVKELRLALQSLGAN